ncbi:putative nuclease HARBI1 [Zingiber officinale]|uniref:putative nuclease HARBI1 n=1 Tax=Zingiber officinale TaxID=94328 RepID=UPI001C4C3A2A|nr:putative nuclease HARBI1 [Zingiber officinale]
MVPSMLMEGALRLKVAEALDCVGTLNGTHIRVKVSDVDTPSYRGRKDWPIVNVLVAWSFDLKFTYILSGWEGIASDSRIVKNALYRCDKLLILHGKYYLVDSGFMLKRGLIIPYRGSHYHLKEYSRCGATNAKELFNLRHASLRNVIKRALGVLKKRFPIIASGTKPHYEISICTDIILACCILHNFLMRVDLDERLISEVDYALNTNYDNEVSCNERQDDDQAREYD